MPYKNFKHITLIGMSGAGKSHLSEKLAQWGWAVYSCDYLIGHYYLSDLIEQSDDISLSDISSLSDFVGKIGDSKKNGLDLETFLIRQKLYHDAECLALRGVEQGIASAGDVPFANDSTGSLCEIEDDMLLAEIGAKTTFVYLKIDQDDHDDICARAIEYPKPLYFPPAFFNENLAQYRKEQGGCEVNDINPNHFLKWIFPRLFRARLPKYQALADKYGVTVNAKEITNIESEDAFIAILEGAVL